MKKILLVLNLIIFPNIFGGVWVHVANNLQDKIKMKAINRNNNIVFEETINPYSTKFIETRLDSPGYFEKIEVTNLKPFIISDSSGNKSSGYTIKRIKPVAMSTYGFVINPKTDSLGNKVFEIKQRIEDHAKLIVRKKQAPTADIFVPVTVFN